jgi:sulfur-carrier protein
MENLTTASVRVCLPFHLRNLAQVGPEVTVEAARPVSVKSTLDAVEARYPMLRGTIRDYDTGKRRAFLRFFACGEDFSLEPMETELPQAVAEGKEPLLVVGAIAGGAG